MNSTKSKRKAIVSVIIRLYRKLACELNKASVLRLPSEMREADRLLSQLRGLLRELLLAYPPSEMVLVIRFEFAYCDSSMPADVAAMRGKLWSLRGKGRL